MANKNLVQSRTLKIKNARGLHARAAAKFAEIVFRPQEPCPHTV